jgi:hypothetical protein
MTPDDELREVFQYQAAQAPDPIAVHARVNRAVDRRRRRNQVVAVASATLAVGGLGLGVQALKPSGQHVVETGVAPTAQPLATTSVLGSNAPSPTADAVPSPPPVPSRQTIGGTPPTSSGGTPMDAINAFFAANYQYDDAVTLSQLWQTDPFTAKAIGGQILRDGGQLPVTPGQRATSTASPQSALVSDDNERFSAAGYTQAQAAELANLWQEPDINLVIVVAGQQLADGHTLPVAP